MYVMCTPACAYMLGTLKSLHSHQTEMAKAPSSMLTGVRSNILLLIFFCFHVLKPFMPKSSILCGRKIPDCVLD